MITVRHQKWTYCAPQSWQECTFNDWQNLLPFSRIQASESNAVQQLACQYWLGVPTKQWRKWQLMPHEWEALQKQFAWVFEKPTTKPLEFVECGTLRLLLPDDTFANSKAIDVAMSFIHFTDFTKNDFQPEALDLLVATLCRPARADLAAFQKSKDYDGDFREPYNEVRVQAIAQKISAIPLETKVIILDYFERMSADFLETYGELFGSDNKEPRYKDGRGWIMMLKNIAKEGHFGSFEQVCNQPVHLVFASALDDVLTMETNKEATNSENNNEHDNY